MARRRIYAIFSALESCPAVRMWRMSCTACSMIAYISLFSGGRRPDRRSSQNRATSAGSWSPVTSACTCLTRRKPMPHRYHRTTTIQTMWMARWERLTCAPWRALCAFPSRASPALGGAKPPRQAAAHTQHLHAVRGCCPISWCGVLISRREGLSFLAGGDRALPLTTPMFLTRDARSCRACSGS